MRYPTDLYQNSASRQMLNVFGGYRHTPAAAGNEFYEMTNLSSDHYPMLSPRGARGTFVIPAAEENGAPILPSPTALIAKDALCWVSSGSFYINGYEIPMELTQGEKQLVSMGVWVVIFPDKKRINTISHEWDSLEATFFTDTEVTFTPCTLAGDGLQPHVDATPPADTKTPWVDTQASPIALKIYSTATESWVPVATTYTKISAPGIDRAFEKFDAVNISCVTQAQLAGLNGWHPIWEKGEGYIVVVGLCPGSFAQEGGFSASRTVPDMDFVIESKNRLWGCKYGITDSGEIVNEIYASKLGDPTNWNCFMGISTDSQVISCGTDGPWTGAIAMDTPLFFKEDWLHRIYGDGVPFGAQITACRGVQRGCAKSMALVGEALLYKARSGVMVYDGSLPGKISDALGSGTYHTAVGGSMGSKYYISMLDSSGAPQLFVYDCAKGLWHREDGLRVTQFCAQDDELYAISGGRIVTMLGSGEKDTAPVHWSAVTGVMGGEDPDQKYLTRLTLRLSMAVGARLLLSVSYDSSGVWENVACITGKHRHSFTLPVRPKRCDHLQLKLEGVGDVKLFSITKTMEQGSELT